MKAWQLHGINDIRLDDIAVPEVSDNEVLVRVKAAGICGSDIPRIYKTGAYHHPLIPGHEFSGLAVKTGKGAEAWQSKRVGIFPLIPCGKCIPCMNEQYEMCRNYSYMGSRRNGGFAEYVVVPANNLIELPDNVTFAEAAMLEPMAVAVHSIRKVNPQKNDNIAICGLGTSGLFIAMFLRIEGMENIYVIGNKDFQKEKVCGLGIPKENYCDCKIDNVEAWINEKTNENGVDVFFECVGRNETINQSLNNTAPGGKVMLVGNPYSDMIFSKTVYWKILRNQFMVMGTWNSSFTHRNSDDWQYVIEKLKSGKSMAKEFISHSLKINELEKGFHIMRDKSEDYIKIMMISE